MIVSFIQRAALLLAGLLLAGCAGTIQREPGSAARRLEGAHYTGVDIVLSEEARRAQADNPLFNARDLADAVRRQLEGRDLLDPQGTYRVEVTIQGMRVRSALSAVLLGVMAGADSIEGFVRVYDARGRQVHGYRVDASYALGGIAGGQDTTRMSWLYTKFAELTVGELAADTPEGSVARRRSPGPTTVASITAQPRSSVAATPAPSDPATAVALAPRPLPTGYAALDDVDAVPYLSDRGRKGYSDWLGRPTPRAFAISPKGNWYATWGSSPRDATLPADPRERAMLLCGRAAQSPCQLYAVDRAVVWKKEP